HRGEAVRLAMTAGDWSSASSIIVEDLAIARLLIGPSDRVHELFLAAPLAKANPQVSIVRAALALAASDLEAANMSLVEARALTGQGKSPTSATELAGAVVAVALARAREDWADVLVRAEEAERLLVGQSADHSARVLELRAVIQWHKGIALFWM